jgi:hypothetical protein
VPVVRTADAAATPVGVVVDGDQAELLAAAVRPVTSRSLESERASLADVTAAEAQTPADGGIVRR